VTVPWSLTSTCAWLAVLGAGAEGGLWGVAGPSPVGAAGTGGVGLGNPERAALGAEVPAVP
jgi:hypothetical protein